MYLETASTRSPVVYRGQFDMHLCIVARRGGPSDSSLPRYYLGVGPTRADALAAAIHEAQAVLGENVQYRSAPRRSGAAA